MADLATDFNLVAFKRFFNTWRIVLLHLNPVMLWEKPWHPYAIVGVISLFYLIIWMLDLSTMATLALVGLFINLVEFIIQIVSNSFYSPMEWTGQHEKKYEDICKAIVIYFSGINIFIRKVNYHRENNFALYSILSISSLCIMTWLSSSINNILIFYALTLILSLWPGIRNKCCVFKKDIKKCN